MFDPHFISGNNSPFKSVFTMFDILINTYSKKTDNSFKSPGSVFSDFHIIVILPYLPRTYNMRRGETVRENAVNTHV